MELSVMTNNFLFAIALAVMLPTISAAQTQTRERRSSAADEAARAKSIAMRDRIVGPRVSNHVEKQKSTTEPAATPVLSSQGDQPRWGNTAAIVRPDERGAPAEMAPGNGTSTDPDKATPKKLVQTTSLVLASPNSSTRASGNINSRPATSPRGSGLSATYNVGVRHVR